MKLISCICAATAATLIAGAPAASGQQPDSLPRRGVWKAVPRDEVSTVWERTETVTNAAGRLEPRIRRYTENSSGLNYTNDSGLLLRSRSVIHVSSDGFSAVASEGPLKVRFPASLGEPIVISGHSETVRIRPAALYWFDARSGKSALLGSIKGDAAGELTGPNRIAYSGACDKLLVTIRYTYARGLEADCILQEQPAPPSAYGLDNTSSYLQLRSLPRGTRAPAHAASVAG